jgi:hypothetical protein
MTAGPGNTIMAIPSSRTTPPTIPMITFLTFVFVQDSNSAPTYPPEQKVPIGMGN